MVLKVPQAGFEPADAEGIVRVRARKLVSAGLGLSVVLATVSGARVVVESPPGILGRRAVAGVLVIAVALAAVVFRERVIAKLERDGRWIAAWAAIIAVAFAIDGPGDELLLPAGLGPIGVAGLVGRPKDALLCAMVIIAGYVGELLLTDGLSSIDDSALGLVAANCAFVLMTVGVIALPVRLGLGVSERVAQTVGQWRIDPSIAPRVVRAARYRALPPGPLLTEQERRVVEMMARGMYYAAIARAERQVLGHPCSERTVRKIVARIKVKTGARTRAEIVAVVDREAAN